MNDSRLISEATAFDNLTLNTGQAIEKFHAIVLEKGTRLNKSDRDMSNKWIAQSTSILRACGTHKQLQGSPTFR